MLIEMGHNISSGILSSSSKGIKKQLNISDSEFGLFGYWNSNGRLVGSFAFLLIFYRINRKWLLTIGLILKASFLCGFFFSNNFKILVFFRFMTGLLHMIPTIYLPTWIDQFGIFKQRPNLIVIYNSFSTIGKVFGYGLSNFFTEEKVNNFILFLVDQRLFHRRIIFGRMLISRANYQ